MEKVSKWKEDLEKKGLKVNVGKTKAKKCVVGSGGIVETGKYPWGVCRKGVGNN